MSIFLIGMPGVGKSTIGVILAKQLGYDFTDADLVIQKRKKRRLPLILEEEGTEGFLRIEAEVCASLAGVRDTVVATGGSACYAADAMEAFRKNGTVVYLEASLETLKRRLRDLKGRGVVLREGQTLEDIWKERIPLYEKYADLKVCEDGLSLEETLEALVTALDQT